MSTGTSCGGVKSARTCQLLYTGASSYIPALHAPLDILVATHNTAVTESAVRQLAFTTKCQKMSQEDGTPTSYALDLNYKQ